MSVLFVAARADAPRSPLFAARPQSSVVRRANGGGNRAMDMAVGAAPALMVSDLHKSFGSLEVLKGVSLSAKNGDVISMIGSSGSGKSTLLRCINLLETPDAGEVYVGGELIRMTQTRYGARPADHKQVDRIRTRLGMVFQSFNLWSHMTVLENVIEAPVHVLKKPKAEAIERAEALLAKVGIAEKRDHYPAHLSGGQQQRAAIARALAMEPQLMLFDEPTSALDPRGVPPSGPDRGGRPAEGGVRQAAIGAPAPVPGEPSVNMQGLSL